MVIEADHNTEPRARLTPPAEPAAAAEGMEVEAEPDPDIAMPPEIYGVQVP